MTTNHFLRKAVAFSLLILLDYLLFACNENSNPPADKIATDTAIYYDTTTYPMPLIQNYIHLDQKYLDELSQEDIQLFAQPNFAGDSLTLTPGSYNHDRLIKFSNSGVRSIKVPFGRCMNINYNVKFTPVPASERPHDRPGPHNFAAGIKAFPVTAGGFRNEYYSPGTYSSIDARLLSPALVTIYPWTDFYFSTDDDIVPPFVKDLYIEYSSNGQKSSTLPKAHINDTNMEFVKSFTYNVPAGKGIHLWESTRAGNSRWSSSFDTVKNVLKVDLFVHGNLPTQARNWVGVRVELTNVKGLQQ